MASTPVQKELSRIAADYRRFFILQGLSLCWAVAVVLAMILLGLFWLGGIIVPYAFQALVGVTAVAALAVAFVRGRKEFALREIARQVEKDDPRLNSLLLAALEQEPDPQTGSLNFLQLRVIREALEANRRSPWNQKFTERLFFAQSRSFALLVCLFVALAALGFAVPQPATTTIVRDSIQITPGNASLEKGSAVAVVAQLKQPASGGVNLVYASPGGGEKKVAMARSLNDPLYGFTLPSVDENTTYHVEYDGSRSEEFKLEVFEYPELKRADAELNYPEYTGLAASKIEDTRRISAVEGTDVHYSFFLNKPVRSAKLLGTNDTEMVLTNSAPNSPAYTLQFPLEESGRFKLELVDDEGRTNKLPTDFVFVALRNEQPKLKLQTPRGDQRVSALQEVRFEAETQDDFGVSAFGIAYSIPGKKTEVVELSNAGASKPHEARAFTWNLPIETLQAEVGELVSYYLWADDLGPDGKVRRSESDIYFAEIRPFEEIFRPGTGDQSSSSQQQGQQQNNPATKLLELQKEIVTATWNLQRRENLNKPSPKFTEDVEVVRGSQESALQQASDLKDQIRDEKSIAIAEQAIKAMSQAEKLLDEAGDEKSVKGLPKALESEQAAYQALLKLQAREYQVSRNRQRGGGGGGGNQRAQRQLDQLEFNQEENRYENESQASPLQTPEQRETLQVLNRLKELARRQQDMTERLKELQTALNEAKTKQEREELERQLKRLQEEQQQIVQDTDELRQRMSQPENQSRMAEARQQLDQTREQSRDAARQLESENVSQALSSSSRAQQQLQQLSDDFRRKTSNQFTEEMRQMRQQARELEQKQQEVAQKMEEMRDSRQRTLGEEGPRQQAIDALAQQRSGLTNLLRNMRNVTEQAEAAEPLLSRQLYETLRRSSQASPEKSLELASQMLERNFLTQAAEAQEKAGQTIRDLKEGVERAARSVLGDEAESLRYAQREIQDLAERAERELAGGTGRNGTNSAAAADAAQSDSHSTNRFPHLAFYTKQRSTNQSPTMRQPGDSQQQSAQSGGENRQGQPGGERQTAQNGREGQQSGQQGEGSQAGEQSEGQQGDGQRGNRSLAQNNQGQNGQGEQPQNGQQQDGQGGSQPGGQGRQNQAGGQQQGNLGGSRNFFDQWANNGGNRLGGTGGGGWEGPITSGAEYTRWSDRLRDVEEVLQDPELRIDVARIREQARTLRAENKRHGEEPQWNLFESDVIRPLRILQNRVAEQLARHNSREAVVPVDRDPVPQKYADAVSRYYERLGKD
jgi:hypothetical protein